MTKQQRAREFAHKQAPKNKLMTIAAQQAAAQVRRASDAAFQSQITTVKIRMLMMDEGEDATEVLSILAVVIGTPAQAAAMIGLHTEPWARQLHGALRSIQDMCLSGYKWQKRYALALDRACEIAGEDQPCLPVETFYRAWLDANVFCEEILKHAITDGAIAA